MKQIKAIFYEKEKSIIGWGTKGKQFHVAFSLIDSNDKHIIVESLATAGVVERDYLRKGKKGVKLTPVIIDVENNVYNDFLRFLNTLTNKRRDIKGIFRGLLQYDFRAFLGFATNKSLQNPNRWYCSELARPLLKSGFSYTDKELELLSPVKLFTILTAISKVQYKEIDK